jgi:CheY-like chemotaxis protein
MQRKVNILLVEDNEADILLIQKNLDRLEANYLLNIAKNGNEALGYLSQIAEEDYKNKPHLIIIDLNLPAMDGKEVLGRIKADKRIKHIPIVVFSSSEHSHDIDQVYNMYANCYVVKPHDFEEFNSAIESIWRFWVGTATLPDFD